MHMCAVNERRALCGIQVYKTYRYGLQLEWCSKCSLRLRSVCSAAALSSTSSSYDITREG